MSTLKRNDFKWYFCICYINEAQSICQGYLCAPINFRIIVKKDSPGCVFPCSHSETFLAVTPKSSPNFTCVSFIVLRNVAMSSAVMGFSGLLVGNMDKKTILPAHFQ